MNYLLFILIYAFCAYCLQRIAKKTKTGFSWFAWIPIADKYLVTSIAGKPFWWLFLIYIPIINIYFCFILWRDIALKFEKPFFLAVLLGLLMIIPVLNWFGLFLFAFIFSSLKRKKKEEIKEEIKGEEMNTEKKKEEKPV